jgi:hypothetical protein
MLTDNGRPDPLHCERDAICPFIKPVVERVDHSIAEKLPDTPATDDLELVSTRSWNLQLGTRSLTQVSR